MAVLRLFLQEVAVLADVYRGGSHDFLADRVDRRIGDLREELLEVVKQRSGLLGKHCKRRVHAHCGDGFAAGLRHGKYALHDLLIGVAECLLKPAAFIAVVLLHLDVGDLQILQPDEVAVQPFAVRLAGCVGFLQLVVVDDPAVDGIHQQHFAGTQAVFGNDLLHRNGKRAHFRRKHKESVVGDIIAGRSQTVAVKHRSHHIAVREENGRGTVPRLHHGGVVLVKIPLVAAHGVISVPRLRNGDHHRQGQRHAAHDEKFQCVVQHRRVGAFGVDHRNHLVEIAFQMFGAHGFLACQHFVGISLDGVDFAVVDDHAVRMRALPAWIGISGESGVDHRDGRLEIHVLQIQKESAKVAHKEHSLIHNRTAGERHDIGVLVALLKFTACHIQPPVKVDSLFDSVGTGDKALSDAGHTVQRTLSDGCRIAGNVAPAENFQAFFPGDDFKHLSRLVAGKLLLGEEEHSHRVIAFAGKVNADARGGFAEEAVRYLNQYSDAVACLAVRVLAGAVFQRFDNGERVVDHLVGLDAFDIDHGAYAAVVMFKRRVIEAVSVFVPHVFHNDLPFGEKTAQRQHCLPLRIVVPL